MEPAESPNLWAESEALSMNAGPFRQRPPQGTRVQLALAAAGGPDRLAQRTRRGEHGRGLVSAVRHAVGAPGVLASPVGVPVGRLDELFIGLHVPVRHQVAGLLPAEQRV